MVTTGKRKYTKKTIMRGGENLFIIQAMSNPTTPKKHYTMEYGGYHTINFIDDTQIRFEDLYNFVKSTQSYSKCYRNIRFKKAYFEAFQLIYKEGEVREYSIDGDAYSYSIVKPKSEFSANFFKNLPILKSNWSFTTKESRPNSNFEVGHDMHFNKFN